MMVRKRLSSRVGLWVIPDAYSVEHLLNDNFVFTLNKPARVLARRNVLETDVARCGAKERDSGANEHGYARDDEALDESRAEGIPER